MILRSPYPASCIIYYGPSGQRETVLRVRVPCHERAYALGLPQLQRESGDLFLRHGTPSCSVGPARLLTAKKGFPASAVPAVVVQTIRSILPPGELAVVDKAHFAPEEAIHPATQVRLAHSRTALRRAPSGQHLRAARRAVEHPVGEAAHLWVAALLAGM